MPSLLLLTAFAFMPEGGLAETRDYHWIEEEPFVAETSRPLLALDWFVAGNTHWDLSRASQSMVKASAELGRRWAMIDSASSHSRARANLLFKSALVEQNWPDAALMSGSKSVDTFWKKYVPVEVFGIHESKYRLASDWERFTYEEKAKASFLHWLLSGMLTSDRVGWILQNRVPIVINSNGADSLPVLIRMINSEPKDRARLLWDFEKSVSEFPDTTAFSEMSEVGGPEAWYSIYVGHLMLAHNCWSRCLPLIDPNDSDARSTVCRGIAKAALELGLPDTALQAISHLTREQDRSYAAVARLRLDLVSGESSAEPSDLDRLMEMQSRSKLDDEGLADLALLLTTIGESEKVATILSAPGGGPVLGIREGLHLSKTGQNEAAIEKLLRLGRGSLPDLGSVYVSPALFGAMIEAFAVDTNISQLQNAYSGLVHAEESWPVIKAVRVLLRWFLIMSTPNDINAYE